jgi:hypothetical protein
MAAIPAQPDLTPSDPAQARTLARAVALAVGATALTLLAVALLAARRDVWLGFAAASVVSLGAAAASVPVVALGLRFGPSRPEVVAASYFGAMFVRALISLGGASAAIVFGDYPAAPTLLMVTPYYLGILIAETAVVARLLLTTRAKPAGGAGDLAETHNHA